MLCGNGGGFLQEDSRVYYKGRGSTYTYSMQREVTPEYTATNSHCIGPISDNWISSIFSF